MRRVLLLAVTTAILSPLAADAQKDAARNELAKLQGTWQLVSAETNGKKAPEEQIKKIRVVIRGQKHTVMFGDKVVAKDIAFQIDPTKMPKTVDDTLPGGERILGIYELNGDRLRSCVAPAGKERPTRFKAGPGSGHTLRVFRRVVEGK